MANPARRITSAGPTDPDPDPDGDPPDATLVVRARHDLAAFGVLYDRYLGAIYRYCHHRLGTAADAEDATSRIFTNALAGLPRFVARDAGSFRRWLFTIAHHTVTDAYRAPPPRTVPLDWALADAAPSPERAALTNAAWDSLAGVLAVLPEDQRRVLALRLAGFTSAEVGGILGRSPLAVRSLQFRAVGHLRRLLPPAAVTDLIEDVR